MKRCIQGLVFIALMVTLSSCGYLSSNPPKDNIFTALNQGDCDRAKDLFFEKANGMDDNSKRFNYIKFLAFLYKNNMCDDVIIELSTDTLNLVDGENQASIYLFRARSWKRKTAYDKALADYNKAVELNPKGAGLSNLAWFLATCPDSKYRNGDKAVGYAKKAIAQADAEKYSDFSILAAAYAEAGNFQEAITTQEKAITLLQENAKIRLEQYESQLVAAEKNGSPKAIEAQKERIALDKEGVKKQIEIYEERIASYKAGNAWRDDPAKMDDEQDNEQ